MNREDAKTLLAISTQAMATNAVLTKMLRALISKGVLSRIEVIAILDAAAEAVERSPDELGGKYSKLTGATIRQMMTAFLDAPEPGSKH